MRDYDYQKTDRFWSHWVPLGLICVVLLVVGFGISRGCSSPPIPNPPSPGP